MKVVSIRRMTPGLLKPSSHREASCSNNGWLSPGMLVRSTEQKEMGKPNTFCVRLLSG